MNCFLRDYQVLTSVILPTYNLKNIVGKAVSSIVRQSYYYNGKLYHDGYNLILSIMLQMHLRNGLTTKYKLLPGKPMATERKNDLKQISYFIAEA